MWMHHGDPYFLMASYLWDRDIHGTSPALERCVRPSKHTHREACKPTQTNTARAACKVLTHGNFLGPRVSTAGEDVLAHSCSGCSLPKGSPSLSLPTLTPYEAMGLWEVAWETRCASFPGSSAGFLRLLASVQQAEPPLEQGFQPSPRTCAVGRAETSVVGSCFRSHLCVEASWPGTTGFAERPLFLFFIFFLHRFSNQAKRNTGSHQRTREHARGWADIDGFCAGWRLMEFTTESPWVAKAAVLGAWFETP